MFLPHAPYNIHQIFSDAFGGSNPASTTHGHCPPKPDGIPNLCHRPSLRLLFAPLIALCLLSLLAGCAATHVAISKRNLEVSTRMSDAVFLDPVGGDKRTAFIYVRNTSDRPNFDIETPLKAAIAGRGYRIVDDPDEAHFKLQAQVLSVSKMSVTAAEAALGAGYGGAVAGVVIGGVAGAATTGTSQGTAVGAVAGGIVGGIAETIANAAVKDVTFVAITDVQISERRGRASSDAATWRSTRSRGSAAARRRRLAKRRRRSATAPGSSARRTRPTSSTRRRRGHSTRD